MADIHNYREEEKDHQKFPDDQENQEPPLEEYIGILTEHQK